MVFIWGRKFMNRLFEVTIIGLISGIIGTGTGGLMAFFVRDISNKILGVILEFSSGLMLAVVCFELIPEAFEYGGELLTFTGIVSGVFAIIIIENQIKKMDYLREHHETPVC
jgi:ZIP family zinc transporter